jgi:hypothetical protein
MAANTVSFASELPSAGSCLSRSPAFLQTSSQCLASIVAGSSKSLGRNLSLSTTEVRKFLKVSFAFGAAHASPPFQLACSIEHLLQREVEVARLRREKHAALVGEVPIRKLFAELAGLCLRKGIVRVDRERFHLCPQLTVGFEPPVQQLVRHLLLQIGSELGKLRADLVQGESENDEHDACEARTAPARS